MSIEKSEEEISAAVLAERNRQVRDWLQWGNEFDAEKAEWCLRILSDNGNALTQAKALLKDAAEALEFYAKKDFDKFSVIDTGKPHPNYECNVYEIIEHNEEDDQEFGETARDALARLREAGLA